MTSHIEYYFTLLQKKKLQRQNANGLARFWDIKLHYRMLHYKIQKITVEVVGPSPDGDAFTSSSGFIVWKFVLMNGQIPVSASML